jgi:hypothetical protein
MDRKLYHKQYYENNKEKRIQQSLNYYHNNRTNESIQRKKEYDRSYYFNKKNIIPKFTFEIKHNIKVSFD